MIKVPKQKIDKLISSPKTKEKLKRRQKLSKRIRKAFVKIEVPEVMRTQLSSVTQKMKCD